MLARDLKSLWVWQFGTWTVRKKWREGLGSVLWLGSVCDVFGFWLEWWPKREGAKLVRALNARD